MTGSCFAVNASHSARARSARSLGPATRRDRRRSDRPRAPGSGRTCDAWRMYASACRRWSSAAASAVSRCPVSRRRACTKSPPLMPMRRWMRHTESSMPAPLSAWRQARTCWSPRGRRAARGPLMSGSGYTLFPPGNRHPALCSCSRCRGRRSRRHRPESIDGDPRHRPCCPLEPCSGRDVGCDASMHTRRVRRDTHARRLPWPIAFAT